MVSIVYVRGRAGGEASGPVGHAGTHAAAAARSARAAAPQNSRHFGPVPRQGASKGGCALRRPALVASPFFFSCHETTYGNIPDSQFPVTEKTNGRAVQQCSQAHHLVAPSSPASAAAPAVTVFPMSNCARLSTTSMKAPRKKGNCEICVAMPTARPHSCTPTPRKTRTQAKRHVSARRRKMNRGTRQVRRRRERSLFSVCTRRGY